MARRYVTSDGKSITIQFDSVRLTQTVDISDLTQHQYFGQFLAEQWKSSLKSTT
jgi:hypothetical protein